MASKEDFLSKVRELSFDKFPVHVFSIGKYEDGEFSLSAEKLTVSKDGETVIDETFTEETPGNLSTIFEKFLGKSIPIAITASFRSDEPLDSVIPYEDVDMCNSIKVYLRNFYSDKTILDFTRLFLCQHLGYPSDISDEDLDAVFADASGNGYEYMQLFVALILVDYRRVYAYAQSIFDGSTFADGSGTDIGGSLTDGGDNISVQIGSVFSLSDDESYQEKFPTNDNGIIAGSENFFGDTDSFWYRLYLWLRDRLENKFGDYSFRKNHGIWSLSTIDRPLSYFEYYESYPYSIQTQQISSGLPQKSS